MNNDKKSLKVHIFGSEYNLKVDEDIKKIHQIADYVDGKMREIQAARPNRPIHQIAILAALNIAVELFHSQDSESEDLKDFTDRIERLNQKIDLSFQRLLEADNSSEVS